MSSQSTELDALADLTEDEKNAIDFYMSEHMYRHQISNSYAGMSCNVGCRTEAMANAIRRHILIPRREKVASESHTPPGESE